MTRRYVQHRHNHTDIVRQSFKRVLRRDLCVAEFEVIRQLEGAGIVLRNIVGTSVVSGESDLDLIIPPQRCKKPGLPALRDPDMRIFARINILWQKVFTVCKDLITGEIAFVFHLARSPLGSILRLRWNFDFGVSRHIYRPGGADQICLETTSPEQALAMLADRRIVRAIRLFNLRLMQKGPCVYSRYYCLDLADHLVARYMTPPHPEAL